MEQRILERALINFEKNTGHKADWELCGPKHPDQIDAKITFKLNGKKEVVRNAEIKKEIRKHHVPQLKVLTEKIGPIILVVERLYPNIKTQLNEAGIDWLDGAGNIHLRDENIFIWIDHHTTTPDKTTKNRAFTKTGLKVVYLFLYDETWLNKTYREIAEATEVALGNIKHVLDGLKEHDFILAKSKKLLKLKNKDKLMDQWLTAFADELKPKVVQGRYRFLDRNAKQEWKDLDLPAGTVWGGEPAADIILNYLKPKEFILYTKKKRADIMKEFKLAPDPKGAVEIRTPYWTIEPEHAKTAPLLTIFTDLMLTGDPRNANVAKMLYGEEI